MTLAHLSDTHLGFRQFARVRDDGVNVREADVREALDRTLQSILERDPDLVVHTGDFFHTVRPSNLVLTGAFRRLRDFQRLRGHRPFVIVAGNHDSPRTSDAGNILKIFEFIEGVTVVIAGHQIVRLDALDTGLLCLPSAYFEGSRVALTPPEGCAHTVLALHGLAAGLLSKGQDGDFQTEDTLKSGFSYVAMGDYHVHQAFAPNACYAGSTEFTSTNPWEEIGQPKGWVYFDTRIGKLEFVSVPTRPHLDLPIINARNLTAAEVDEQILANAQWTEAMPVVRQRVTNLSAQTERELDAGIRRKVGERALNYYLDGRRGAAETAETGPAAAPKRSLNERWKEHVEQWQAPPDVSKPVVLERGSAALRAAQDLQTYETTEA